VRYGSHTLIDVDWSPFDVNEVRHTLAGVLCSLLTYVNTRGIPHVKVAGFWISRMLLADFSVSLISLYNS